MANTISTDFRRGQLLDTAMEAFREELLPLRAFSMKFDPTPMYDRKNGTYTVDVPYVPVAASAYDFTGTYAQQNTTWSTKSVTIDKHKVVDMSLTDTEMANTPMAELRVQFAAKGHALGQAVLEDIMSLIVASNFSSIGHTGAASTMDTDKVADIRGVLNALKVPKLDRSLVLADDYYTNLAKDNDSVNVSGQSETRSEGTVPRVHGFNVYESLIIPANGENLEGFACHSSAIGVGLRYLQPQEGHTYLDARPIIDEETGLVFGFRDFYEPVSGTRTQVLECNYGRAVIEETALTRIRSSG